MLAHTPVPGLATRRVLALALLLTPTPAAAVDAGSVAAAATGTGTVSGSAGSAQGSCAVSTGHDASSHGIIVPPIPNATVATCCAACQASLHRSEGTHYS